MKRFSQTTRLEILSPDQELLVRAALGPEKDAREALTTWLAQANLSDLDGASRSLIPLAYDRARREGIEHPILPVLKGVKRYVWYNNQLLFREAGNALRALRLAGIEVMLLKGAAVTLKYYHDFSLRPMDDVDLLVPTKDAQHAVEVFQEHGYVPERGILTNPNVLRCCHAVHFLGASGRDLDLHWHLLPFSIAPDADDDFWEASSVTDFKSESIHILDPADQLLHILVHGAFSREAVVAPLRWIPDAIAIMGNERTLNWRRLITQARKTGVVPVVRMVLNWLAQLLHPPIPPEILTELNQIPVSACEQWKFRWRFQSEQSVLRSVVLILLEYGQIRQDAGEPWISFSEYLRGLWKIDDHAPLMEAAFQKLAAKWSAHSFL